MPASDPSAWVVHKFGGSSVADADCFRRVANILETLPPGRLGVVLSACRGVTDALLRSRRAAPKRQDDAWRGDLDALRARHATIARDAADGRPRRSCTWRASTATGTTSKASCIPSSSTRSAAPNVRDLIAGYGEIWSTKLFREFFDARGKPSGRGAVDRRAPGRGGGVGSARSRRAVGRIARQAARARCRPISQGTLIITGFIASRPARRADHARPQRQRLLRFHLRLAARRQRDPHLDRRRRRAVGRSAPRARRQGHRLAVVQRGHGAGVLRRQGDPSADHGARRGPRHPDLDPQHLRARRSRAR